MEQKWWPRRCCTLLSFDVARDSEVLVAAQKLTTACADPIEYRRVPNASFLETPTNTAEDFPVRRPRLFRHLPFVALPLPQDLTKG